MSSDEAFLGAAASIGRRIVADAVWHDGRCSWMGAFVDPAQPWRAEHRALGPNLYGGTAGVGLFLSQLAAVTGDAPVRRAAVGALRHALARAPALPLDRRDGFHTGAIGIAWAAARAAALVGEEELLSGARAVVADARSLTGRPRCPHVVMGSAGAIIGLLALVDALDDPTLVEAAVTTGEDLIARATVSRHGWSWAIPGPRYPHHLCGVSHGAAGIGWALVELFAATDDERFRAGATGAFAYERSWLDASSGTWPDLRIGGRRRGAPPITASTAASTWCHGEAGIALTRLRAVALLGPGAELDDAQIALATTRRRLAGALPYDIEDLSLCHGAGGSADVLLCGAAALGAPWEEAARLATDLGRIALERQNDAGGEWPCSAAGGRTPGLFLGLSGIAWLFLRLHDQGIASPLVVRIRT
jgi:lantibiotic modifying enzyme